MICVNNLGEKSSRIAVITFIRTGRVSPHCQLLSTSCRETDPLYRKTLNLSPGNRVALKSVFIFLLYSLLFSIVIYIFLVSITYCNFLIVILVGVSFHSVLSHGHAPKTRMSAGKSTCFLLHNRSNHECISPRCSRKSTVQPLGIRPEP